MRSTQFGPAGLRMIPPDDGFSTADLIGASICAVGFVVVVCFLALIVGALNQRDRERAAERDEGPS